jgi:exopolyphosphatase/guanosine-5'-triphosphate,3'-diphosphate pyrophosphatase
MTTSPNTSAETLAVLDLGSNSFHLVVATLRHGELQVVDRLRETVRLAAGMDQDGRLAPDAITRALECLGRFAQRLRGLPPEAVRAVGTNTLRSATDGEDFLRRAEAVLGHDIEVVSGREEARLIYQGVSHSVADDGRRRLVLDIGGGSTEFIIGEHHEPLHMESTAMGCVTWSQAHFPDGAVTARTLNRAKLAALMQIEPYQAFFQNVGWEHAIGTSGTLRAVERVLRLSGWTPGGITLTGLRRLADSLVKAGRVEKLQLPGLSETRMQVFAGGMAIALAAFEALGIDHMQVSDGALREGLLYDLMGRLRHEDVRSRSVAALATRFGVDAMQAARVERTAVALLAEVADAWNLDDDGARQLLRWAAQLHELGLAVAHNGHHKHGAYILENADLPGFSHQEQLTLAAMVRGHRRKFPAPLFKKLTGGRASLAARLTLLLRLSATLHRSRNPAPLPHLKLDAADARLHIHFPPDWLDAHPLTRADLAQEADYLKAAGIRLSIA